LVIKNLNIINAESTILNQKLELIQWLSTIEYFSILEKIMTLKKMRQLNGGI
jgi:hypothetical protein